MTSKTKNIEVEVFVADDGTEFSVKDDCIKYEENLENNKKYEQALSRIEKLAVRYDPKKLPDLIPLNVFVRENGYVQGIKHAIRHDAYIYYQLNDMEDAEALAIVLSHKHSCYEPPASILKKTKLEFPCLVFISMDYHYFREIGTMEKQLDVIRRYCKMNGYSVSFQKKEA